MGLKVYDNFIYNKVLKKIKSRFSYAEVDVINGKLIIEVPYELFTQMNFLGIDIVSLEEINNLNVNKIVYLIDYKGNPFVEPNFKDCVHTGADLIVRNAVINDSQLFNSVGMNAITFESCKLFEEGTLRLKCDSANFKECNVSRKQKIILEREIIKEYRLLKSGKKIFLGDDNEFKVIYKDGAKIISVEEDIPTERVYDYLDAYDSRDFERYVFGYSLTTRKESLKTILVLYNDLGCSVVGDGYRRVYLCDLSDRFIKSSLSDYDFNVIFRKAPYETYGHRFGGDGDIWSCYYSRERQLSSFAFLSEAKKYISRIEEILPIVNEIVDINKELNSLKKECNRVETDLDEIEEILSHKDEYLDKANVKKYVRS